MSQILESFTSLELPDAIDAILLGADDMEPGSTDAALSRYASRLFGELGASRMRDIATSHHVATGRLSNTDLFWLRFNPSELSEEEFGYLLATEGIMNRLRLVEEVFESHAGTQGADEARGSFAEGECAMADIGVIEGVSYAVPRMLHSSPNHLKSIHGASCKRGGEWDVRSRFALAVESLRLPFRLMYHFDCDAANGLFRVNFNAPAGAWMPRCRFEADIETWVDASDQQEALASEYTLRLAAVLAAAAFGSGVGIKRVHLLADPLWDSEGTSLSLVVDRIPFIAKLLPDIVDGDPSWLERFREMFEGTDEELDEQLRCRHLPLSRDTRELPEDLKKLLHADLACELDVRSQDDDERWDAVREAYEDSETSPVAAIATLEALVADAGAIEADEQGRFPLFCTDEVARVAVHQTVVADETRYVRYPDWAFSARTMLCDLYIMMGEPERALEQAREMIHVAPSSTPGYTDAANALFEMNRHAEAGPYLQKALSLATYELPISWIYYRLAFSMWQAGKRREGLACYVMSAHHGFPRPEVLADEVGELLGELGLEEPPTTSEALEVLRSCATSLPLSNDLMHDVATAAIELADHGFFEASSLLCSMPDFVPNCRDELVSIAASMKWASEDSDGQGVLAGGAIQAAGEDEWGD